MRATLDGYKLEVESGVEWALVPGVAPAAIQVEVNRAGGALIFGPDGLGPGKSWIRISDGVNAEVWLKLTILSTSPSANPGTILLTIVDSRYTWPYRFVARRYNVPRKSPNKVRVGKLADNNNPGAQTQATGVRPDIVYAGYSLENGKDVWTAPKIAVDVLDIVIGSGEWEDRDGVISRSKVPAENWEFNMQGDAAVAKLFSYMGGGINCYVDDAGKTIVYSTQDLGEDEELNLTEEMTGAQRAALAPLIGSQFVALQDRVKERPKKVRVLFERQVEIRFDIRENASFPPNGTFARNVIPMPEDGTIPADKENNVPARELIEGTWVTFDTFLEFCKANPAGNLFAASYPLNAGRIQKFWLSGALFAYAHNELDRGGVWRKRIGYVLEHYRRTYQINSFWRDRIRRIYPYLVSLEDRETGSRAPAPVYQDYCAIHAWKPSALKDDVTDEEVYRLVQNQYANPDADPDVGGEITSTPASDLNKAPARLTVVEQDMGIVQISLVTDFTGLTDRFIRSACDDRAGGKANFGGKKILIQDTKLSAIFEASFIVTCAMGAPNDKRRFFAFDRTGPEVDEDAGEGPELEIRVALPRAVARYPWVDANRDKFIERFGSDVPENEDAKSPLPQLDGDDIPLNGEQLARIADAFAKREYIRFKDHAEGVLTTTYRPFAKIAGNISRVTHNLATSDQGGATTTVELAPTLPGVDALALMPPDVRRMVEGFVEP